MAANYYLDPASARSSDTLIYAYNRVAVKNLDQMNRIVRAKIRESRTAGGDRRVALTEGLQAVFARPNDDFMIEKILPPLKSELEDLGAWESSVRQLTTDSLRALSKNEKFKTHALVTYAVMLENLMAEFRPRAHLEFENALFVQIRDAKVKLPPEVRQERKLRMMREVREPSELAATILAEAEKRPKNEVNTEEEGILSPTPEPSVVRPSPTPAKPPEPEPEKK